MESFAIKCTTCSARLKVRDPAAIGRILTCPKCGSMVEVVAPVGSPGEPSRNGHAAAVASIAASAIPDVSSAANPRLDSPRIAQPAAMAGPSNDAVSALAEQPVPAASAPEQTAPAKSLFSFGGSAAYGVAGCVLGFALALALWLIVGNRESSKTPEQANAEEDANVDGDRDSGSPQPETPVDPKQVAADTGKAKSGDQPGEANEPQRDDPDANDKAATPEEESDPVEPIEATKQDAPKSRDAAPAGTSMEAPSTETSSDPIAEEPAVGAESPESDDTNSTKAPPMESEATDSRPTEPSQSEVEPQPAPPTIPTLSVQEIEERLGLTLAGIRTPEKLKLSELLSLLATMCNAPLELEVEAIERAGLAADPEVSIDLKNTTARQALEAAAAQASLALRIEVGRATIGPPDRGASPDASSAREE